MQTQLQKEFNDLPQEERTEANKEKIFSKAMGTDSRGRVRCMGVGPSMTTLKEIKTSNIAKRVEDVRKDMEDRMKEELERLDGNMRKREEERMEELHRLKEDMRKREEEHKAEIAGLRTYIEAFIESGDNFLPARLSGTPPPTRGSNALLEDGFTTSK